MEKKTLGGYNYNYNIQMKNCVDLIVMAILVKCIVYVYPHMRVVI